MIITALHVHHAVIPAGDYNGRNGPDCVDRIRQMHMNRKPPFRDIGYHFVAFGDGKWLPGRDIHLAPASASGHNGKYDYHPAAICCFADFRRDPITDGYVKAVREIRELLSPHSFDGNPLNLIPHRAMQQTWCPMEPQDWLEFVLRVEGVLPELIT